MPWCLNLYIWMTGKGHPSTFHRKYMEKMLKFIRMYYGTQDRPFRFSLENVNLEWRQLGGRVTEAVTQSRELKGLPQVMLLRWCCSGGPGMPQPFPRRPDRPVSPWLCTSLSAIFQYHYLSGSELSFCCLQSELLTQEQEWFYK